MPDTHDVPIVDHAQAVELPWRPGYRNFVLSGRAQGVGVSVSMGILEPGAGAPLHRHPEVDEVLVVLEGEIDVQLGEQRIRVGPEQTISIPCGVPHAFFAIGPRPARFIGFLPRQGAYAAAEYLTDEPPQSRNAK